MNSFPLYLLRFGRLWQIVFPKDKADLGHTEFWEETVCHIVAQHYRIPAARLRNLPYCQRRARVVSIKVYFGGKPNADLLRLIRQAVGNDKLEFVYDEHEKRLRDDVREFRRLVRRFKDTDRKG